MSYTKRTLSLTALMLLLATHPSFAQQPIDKVVAFATVTGNPIHYVTVRPSGGLDVSATTITEKQTFTLTDLNGGEVENGDQIRIKYTPGSVMADGTVLDPGKVKPSYWYETNGVVKRLATAPTSACIFKVVLRPDKTILLQAESGKFVADASSTDELKLVEKQEEAQSLQLVPNPLPK
jgi:hypothetical protein